MNTNRLVEENPIDLEIDEVGMPPTGARVRPRTYTRLMRDIFYELQVIHQAVVLVTDIIQRALPVRIMY